MSPRPNQSTAAQTAVKPQWFVALLQFGFEQLSHNQLLTHSFAKTTRVGVLVPQEHAKVQVRPSNLLAVRKLGQWYPLFRIRPQSSGPFSAFSGLPPASSQSGLRHLLLIFAILELNWNVRASLSQNQIRQRPRLSCRVGSACIAAFWCYADPLRRTLCSDPRL